LPSSVWEGPPCLVAVVSGCSRLSVGIVGMIPGCRSGSWRHGMGVHRRTVRQALASAEPPPRKVPQRAAPVLDPVKPVIDAMLREDLTAPRKQRHTARRVRERLIEEHRLVVAHPTVRDYVRDARPRIAAEAGKQLAEVFVPQTHAPAGEAEVDFADLWIVPAGVKTKVFLFTLRLSCSGKAVHRAYATASQEAFLDGHRYAFEPRSLDAEFRRPARWRT